MKKTDNTHVLIVDDDEFNRLFFKALFKNTFEVSEAASGAEGLEMLAQNEHIRVVISDMKMPGMSGMEFIEAASKIYSDKKYIVLTGYSMDQKIAKALKTGLVSEFFQKPYNEDVILEAIQRLLDEESDVSDFTF